MSTLEQLRKSSKKELYEEAKKRNLKNISNKKKDELVYLLLENKKGNYTPICKNNKNYDKIYHLSDIHIRPLDRHIEYNEVFNELYKIIEKDNLIVITGDLLHEKDKLKPETYLFCRDFLKKLSLIGDVILITGNHDMLENNPDRIDNLTAICDDLPIEYLVNSGVYQYGNVIFAVSSLVDKKFIYRKNIKGVTEYPVIALYHGTLNGAVTDYNYEFNNSTRFRKKSDFDGYDLVLLGDIHRHQYIDKDKTIGYPGSLIQQNFGETLENHGILEWDIKTKKSKFIPIINNYGFINITVTDNKYSLPKNIPSKCYIKILLNDSDEKCIDKIRNKLSNITAIQQLKYNYVIKNNILNNDVTSHENDEMLIKNEMKLRNYDDDKQDEIIKLHLELKKKCNISDQSMNNNRWKLLTLNFENVFIFDTKKTINFKDNPGIYEMNGPNVSGKTSTINTIIYLLFGGSNKINVLNKSKNDYFIEGIVQYGEKKLKIVKTGTRKNKTISHTINFHIYEDGKWVCKNKETSTETTKLVSAYFGSYEQFLLMNVCSNSSFKSILVETNQEKLKILSKLFYLDIYEELEGHAKNKKQEIENKLSILIDKKKDITYDENNIDSISSNISKLEKNKIEYVQKKEKLNNDLNRISHEFSPLKTKIKPIDIDEYDKKYQDIISKRDIDIIDFKAKLKYIKDKIYIVTITKKENYSQDDLNNLVQNNDIKKKELDNEIITFKERVFPEKVKNFKPVAVKNVNFSEDKLLYLKSQLMYFRKKDYEIIKINDDYCHEKNCNKIRELENDLRYLQKQKEDNNEKIKKYKCENISEYLKYDVTSLKTIISDMDKKVLKENVKYCVDYFDKLDCSGEYIEVKCEKIKVMCKILKTMLNDKNKLKYVLYLKVKEDLVNQDGKLNDELSILKRKEYSYLLKLKEEYDLYEEQKLMREYLKYQDYKNKKVIIDNLKAVIGKNNAKVAEISNYLENIEKYNKNIEYVNEIKKLEKSICEQVIRDDYNGTLEYLENKQGEDEFYKVSREIRDIDEKLLLTNSDLSNLGKELNELIDKQFKKCTIEQKISKINNTIKFYNEYIELVNKRNIPAKLIKKKIKNIENYINEYVKKLTRYQISIDFDYKNGICFTAVKDNIVLDIKQLSGYETLILNIISKLALNKFCFISKSSLFIIDEGLDVIDSNNLKHFNYLKETINSVNCNTILIKNQ